MSQSSQIPASIKDEQLNVDPQAIAGCIMGLMVGDSIGLPFEGIGRRRIQRLNPGPLRQRLLFGGGMISDDSEHCLATAAAIAVSLDDDELYRRQLAWRLRWWFMRLPAGIGLATGRAVIKLWLGFSPQRSGVYSAGNGPAMRAPIVGVCYGADSSKLIQRIMDTTLITHRDPKALIASLAVAQAAYQASIANPDWSLYRRRLQALWLELCDGGKKCDVYGLAIDEFEALLDRLGQSLAVGQTAQQVAEQFGLANGVTGYIYHTVPLVLLVWQQYPDDFASAVEVMVRLGGDTDTTAAIVAGIVGAQVQLQGIPAVWRQSLIDWPLSRRYALTLAQTLADSLNSDSQAHIPWLPGPLLFLRNMVFFVTVLIHGFRRLLPPYSMGD